MRELFRRLVFNILLDNTDDHEKNHVLLVSDAQQLVLSPAFDVLPSGQSLGYQAMIVGEKGAESSIDNALSACRHYWLSRQEAVDEAKAVARVVETWYAHFKLSALGSATLDELTACIDRPALIEQRRTLL